MGTIVNNSFKYPILFVTQGKNSYRVNHILGATMIKIENNHSMNDNPYFPTVNEDVLTISCILTKYNAMYKNHKIKGIGSKLFRICIKSANEINKNKKIRLICEVDCRNINCFHSIKKAIQELQSQNINVKVCITGYYEIKDNQQHLLEAPTFILEMILEGNETKMAHDDIELNYSNCYSEDLFEELKGIIQHNTQEKKEYKNNDE